MCSISCLTFVPTKTIGDVYTLLVMTSPYEQLTVFFFRLICHFCQKSTVWTDLSRYLPLATTLFALDTTILSGGKYGEHLFLFSNTVRAYLKFFTSLISFL